MISQAEVNLIVRQNLDTKSSLLDTEEERQKMSSLNDTLLHFPNWEEKLGTASFEWERTNFLATLIEIKNSPLNSSKGKIRQNLENNGLLLPELIQLYNKHNKSEKEIIEELRGRFLNGRGYKVRDWTLTSQEKSAFQDPAIDNQGSMKELEEMINELREIDNKINNGENLFSHLKKLKECQNASPSTDLGKATQALNNNGDLLNNAINSLTRKSKEGKEKILNSLSDWYYNGNIYNVKEKNASGYWISYQNGEADSWGSPGIFLLEKDFQEAKQAIINNIIKIVKENPSEWKIVEICTFDADMYKHYTLGATKGYQEWDVILISKSSSLEYDDEGFLIRKPQKMHDESLFTKEELQQIKNILGVSAIEKIPFQKNGYKLNDEAETKKNEENSSKGGTIIAIIFLAGIVAGAFFVFFKKKN